jgi:Zn-dependent M32 family carboxypeptidase
MFSGFSEIIINDTYMLYSMLAEERMKTIWFLFSKLRDSQYSGEFEKFGYYLEAIIPLARSVTHGIQKEFRNSDEFLDWYGYLDNPKEGTKIFEMRNDELFKFFNEERNIILKEAKTPDKNSGFEVMAFYDGDLEFKPKIMVKREGQKISGRLVHPKKPKIEIKGDIRIIYKYYFEKKPKLQALIYLHKYLRKLEKIVIEAKQLFSESPEQ